MCQAAVKALLEEIEGLGAKDRLALERELARRAEAAWRVEAGKARRTAKRRNITQVVIDRAIEQRRYGG
jgi:hypothetical protein